MDAWRRTIFNRIGLLCIAAIGFTTTTSEAASWNRTIEATIRIEDETGVPIPYVTAWFAMEQPVEHTRATVWPAAHLSVADLWRITQRYGALHDIISSCGEKPVPYLGVPVMGNAEGTFDVRLARLRDQLEQTAQQAIAAGDKKAAARIYSRMRYLPSLNIVNGQIAGYSQADPTSAQARHALDLAYQLDPKNLYVWMHTYGRRAVFPPNASREDRIRVNLPLLEKMIAANGEKIWPLYYSVRASSYASLGDFTTARRLYLEAKKMEPKFDDWDRDIEALKRKMKLSGVATSPPN